MTDPRIMWELDAILAEARDDSARRAAELAATIAPLLAGLSPQIQGAALADLTATWVAGHIVAGNAKATARMRREMLRVHYEAVQQIADLAR